MNYEQDTFIFYDGFAPLRDAVQAGIGSGRFLFVLGNIETDDSGDSFETDVTTFDIDIFDTFLSKRTRIKNACYLHSFGERCGFYSLDDTTFVLISHNQDDQVLRQWLLHIDMDAEKASCDFYRCYTMDFDGNDKNTTVGEEFVCAATSRRAYLLPKHPLCSTAHREITSQINQAVNCLMLRHPGKVTPNNFNIDYLAFFITRTVVGFFVEKWENGDYTFDLTFIVVLDLINGTSYLQEVYSSSNTDLSIKNEIVDEIIREQSNDREVVMHGCRNDKVIFYGILNTRRLEYTEMEPHSGMDSYTAVVPYHDCFIVADKVKKSFVSNSCSEFDRLTIVRHPLRVTSLTRLAAIALQTSERCATEDLKQIADRIGSR